MLTWGSRKGSKSSHSGYIPLILRFFQQAARSSSFFLSGHIWIEKLGVAKVFGAITYCNMPNRPLAAHSKRLHFLPETYLVYNTPSRLKVENST